MSSPYASAHQSPNGAGDARPTAKQIVKDENRVDGLKNKTVFITGCSSGIGIETARALFTTGATLYLTARDLEKAKQALPDLSDSDRVHFLELDLNSLDSVSKCAKAFLAQQKTLNILIANAGVMHTPEGKTADGLETQFGINFVAHFLLFKLLEPALLAGTSTDFASRVVVVSSAGHRICGVDFDDLNFEKRDYNGWVSYGQSKTAVIYLANAIDRYYGSKGIHALSLHPGSIFSGLQKTVPDAMRAQWKDEAVLKVIKSTEQGAATTVFGAVARSLEGKGAVYLEDCAAAQQVKEGGQMREPGYAAHAFDQEKEDKLWERATEIVKPWTDGQ